MSHANKFSQAELARAVGVRAPSVNDWLTGKTKSLSGPNLLKVARYFEVRPDWLGMGRGPMLDEESTEHIAEPQDEWPFSTSAEDIRALNVDQLQTLDGIVADFVARAKPKKSPRIRGAG